MSALAGEVSAWWWSWIAVSAVRMTPVLLAALVVERLLPVTVWPGVRRAGIGAAVALLLVPPQLAWPWTFVAVHAASDWVMNAAAAPQGLTLFASVVVVVWFVGVGVVASATLLLTVRSRRRWLAGAVPTPAWLQEALQTTAERFGVRRRPRLVVSKTVPSACVTGTWGPTVFVPASLLEALPSERIGHVLAHELAHVARRDLWAAAIVAVVRVVYWFHPLVWLAEHRLGALRELGADRAVARKLEAETAEYRRTLLYFAARAVGDSRALVLSFVRPTTLILTRLRLLERRPARRWIERSVAGVMLSFIVVALVPASRDASNAALGVAEVITRPPGCLQLRYLVHKRLAEAERGEEP